MEALERIDAILAEVTRIAEEETADAPPPQFTGEAVFPMQLTVGKGLEGAVVCTTEIGYVDGVKGWLVYRGLNTFDLARFSTFEETSYLLIHGTLPTAAQLAEFSAELKKNRQIPERVIGILRSLPSDTHPMALLRTAVSALGCLDEGCDDATVEKGLEITTRLIAQVSTITGAIARLRAGLEPVEPHPDLGHAANFLYSMTGEIPDPVDTRIMDINLVLHADHGMNASTFTSLVISSSLPDLYSSICGAIGSLKGPLHGGANERVLYDLREIGAPENVEKWYAEARASKRKVMGFGHRVYKAYDPRARILGPLSNLMAELKPELKPLCDTARNLERAVVADLGASKAIFPNVDFYSGVVYSGFGIDPTFFTPIFAVSRISGWCARVLEYLADNRILRPRAIYTGPAKVHYTPIDDRS